MCVYTEVTSTPRDSSGLMAVTLSVLVRKLKKEYTDVVKGAVLFLIQKFLII